MANPNDTKQKPGEKSRGSSGVHLPSFSPKLITQIADEVAKTLVTRLPNMGQGGRKKRAAKENKRLEYSLFLDTSAIIDGRIFDVIETGLFAGSLIIVPASILLELKHIADSQDVVKRERGRRGLEKLEKLKKSKKGKLYVLSEADEKKDTKGEIREVDERLIRLAKIHKGRIITCDYNLEKKASIQGVTVINMYAMANYLKVQAVPGEALHVKMLHPGKDVTQGVGYLDDGTMIVVENGNLDVGKMVDAVVVRIIQTAAGRILFAKKM